MEPTRRRAWRSNLAIVVATACWPLLLHSEEVAGDFQWPTGTRLGAEIIATAVALGLVLTLRRRRPMVTALAVLPLSVTGFAVVPAMVAVYTVAARRGRTSAVLIGGAYATVSVLASIRMNPSDGWLSQILVMAVIHAIPVSLGMMQQARRALLDEYASRARRAESEQQLRIEQARQLERQRIAREMHDVVAHRISLVSLHAGGLANWPDAPPTEVARSAEVIRASAHEALEELRGVIHVLRDAGESAEPARPQPTLADLPELVARCRAAGTAATVDDETGDGPPLPASVGRTAYRVIEEGLTNAAKHAPDVAVTVRLRHLENHVLVVEVANALPLRLGAARGGAATVPGAGAGLIGLAERVALAGGHLAHGPSDDGRFRLRAELPWPS